MFGMMGMGGDFDDDFMGNHMNAMNMQMRSMNRMMSSLMPDPFNMLTPFDPGFQQNAMMERGHHAMPPMGGLFGFPAMPNMNRLLSADIGAPNGASYCSSSVISMSSGPDGRPQIYQATSSTKTGPGGIRETRKTVQDSSMGVKKMAIGHHIGDRAHIIEKEQDLRSGQLEERQEFVNLEEEEAEDFDREFTNKASLSGARPAQRMLAIEPVDDDEPRSHQRQLMASQQQLQQQQQQQQQQQRRQLPALPAPPQQHNSSTLSSHRNTSSSSSLSSSAANATTANVYGEAYASAAADAANHNNNNNYMNTTPRRAYRSHHGAAGGATPRRPLRTPTSSPLTTTPTNHSHSTATSPSVHPHPYNASAARRNYRPKHTKQHQQQQQQPPAAATTLSPTTHAAATSKQQHQQDNSNN